MIGKSGLGAKLEWATRFTPDSGNGMRVRVKANEDGGAVFIADSLSRDALAYPVRREHAPNRLALWRNFRADADPKEMILWVMMNPSSADEYVLDPTLRRCEGHSRAWGASGFVVANIFSIRETDPKDVLREGYDFARGMGNDETIDFLARNVKFVVVGWGGAKNRMFARRASAVMGVLQFVDLFCVGTNADGSPQHPLYSRSMAQPMRFDSERYQEWLDRTLTEKKRGKRGDHLLRTPEISGPW